jgi:hypothetical protein
VEKYLNLQNAKRNSYVIAETFAGFQNIVWYTNAVLNQDCVYTLYSKIIYLTRSLPIAATKTVDSSYIKDDLSTQVSSKK